MEMTHAANQAMSEIIFLHKMISKVFVTNEDKVLDFKVIANEKKERKFS